MEAIRIDPDFGKWVEEVMVKDLGVEVSPAAQQGIAYLLQAQLDDGIVKTKDEVLDKADLLLKGVLDKFIPQYKAPAITLNRALHLITHANETLRVFPWERTMELDESKLPQGIFNRQPEKV
jgi:hypothetical protein